MPPITGPIGIVANPYSRLMRGGGLIEALSARVSPDRIAITERAAEAPAAVESLLRAGTRIVAVAGGDGTLCSVVTAAIGQRPADRLPTFLPLRAGAWNHVANGVGLRGDPIGILDRALVLLSRGRLSSTRLGTLRVSNCTRPGADYGFNLFVGSIYDIVEDGHRRGPGRRHVIAALLASFAAREQAPYEPLEIIADERPLPAADSAWMSSLHQRHPRSFLLSLGNAHALTGYFELSKALLRPFSSDERSLRVHRSVIQQDRGYVLDGDLFPADQPYVCSVSAGPTVAVVSDIRKTRTRLLTI